MNLVERDQTGGEHELSPMRGGDASGERGVVFGGVIAENPTSTLMEGNPGMAIRSNHYDVAFEAYLRTLRTPYVSVDETRRALLAEASLKSFDFIVYSPAGENLLVDVKGRRFPTVSTSGTHCWENWATRDDLVSLLQWEQVFGSGFQSVLVFAYDVQGEPWLGQHGDLFEFRQRTYSFYVVSADDYAAAMTRRSPQWETFSLPAAEYRRLRRPLGECLGVSRPVTLESTG